MICDICKGTGTVGKLSMEQPYYERIPCPNLECHQGHVSCCEGAERYGQLFDEDTELTSGSG